MPESPQWLVSEDRDAEACEVLKMVYPDGYGVDSIAREIWETIEKENKDEGRRPVMGSTRRGCGEGESRPEAAAAGFRPPVCVRWEQRSWHRLSSDGMGKLWHSASYVAMEGWDNVSVFSPYISTF